MCGLPPFPPYFVANNNIDKKRGFLFLPKSRRNFEILNWGFNVGDFFQIWVYGINL